MLVKPTVVQLLDKAENRYRLAIATAKRARQISQGSQPMTETDDISPVSIAADEIEAGALKIYDEEEWKEVENEIATNKETDENNEDENESENEQNNKE